MVITFVYSFNRGTERLDLWHSLRQLSSTQSLPWLCLGDFNVSLSEDERVGYAASERDMQDFRDCLSYCSLVDHPYSGGLYTWYNKQVASPRWAKLDRLLANPAWFLQVPNSNVVVLPVGVYVVSQGWRVGQLGSRIFTLFSKLRYLCGSLKKIHSNEFAGLSARVLASKEELTASQRELQSSPLDQQLLSKEKSALGAYIKLKEAELRALAQRAKVTHLQQTDDNTRYFYASITARRTRNTVGAIEDIHGNYCAGHTELSQAFLAYYQTLLGSSEEVTLLPSLSSHHILTATSTLDVMVTSKEIEDALFSIDRNKSPGVDRYTSGFFKDTWGVTWSDFTAAVQEFFRKGTMPRAANSTLIALIPKCDSPRSVT
ncbi:uncharacterized protein LOC141588557 [Silene latifolia]|uniref:uncharacterized protein LOC141588557 n=1 Tax=Silene latifolia TaxID=37657 RepID=UPI003D76E5F2